MKKRLYKNKILIFFLANLLVFAIASGANADRDDSFAIIEEGDEEYSEFSAYEIMEDMSLEEKICQMFFLIPEDFSGESHTLECSDHLADLILQYPVGGLLFKSSNMQTEEQFRFLLEDLNIVYRSEEKILPWLAITEEGGLVSPFHAKFGIDTAMAPGSIAKTDITSQAYESGNVIGELLSSFGLNMDFAPLADIPEEGYRESISGRLIGVEPGITAGYANGFLKGLQMHGVIGVMKHFPNNGAVTDSRTNGNNNNLHTIEVMRTLDWLPYKTAIREENLYAVQVSNLKARKLDDNPCVFSSFVIQDCLRNELGFEGLIITDMLSTSSIIKSYSSAAAAVAAVKAGADIIYLPEDFYTAYHGLLSAVQKGDIPVERIDRSVERILDMKIQFGILR